MALLLLSSVLLLNAAGVRATLTTSSPTPVPVTVTVHATTSGPGATPFLHKWKRSFGSGHASLRLRSD